MSDERPALRIEDLATGFELVRGGFTFSSITPPVKKARTLSTTLHDGSERPRKFRSRIIGWEQRFVDGHAVIDLKIKALPRRKARGLRRHIRRAKAL